MSAIVVAGTGKVSPKAALALIKDHYATLPDEDDAELILPLGKDTKHVNYSLLDHVDEFANVTLLAYVGAHIDEEVLDNVDNALFIDNPNGHAFDNLTEDDTVLLAFDEENEDQSIKALKLAQSKGATVLDLTDGLLELQWSDDPEDDADEDESTEVDEPVDEEPEPTPEDEPTLMEKVETVEMGVVEKPKRTRKPKAEPVVEEPTFDEPVFEVRQIDFVPVLSEAEKYAEVLKALNVLVDAIADRVVERLSK
jgi:hypothetical protein